MFCKNCGKSNEKHSLYCSDDGTFLHNKKSSISLRRGDIKFCKSCGQSIQSSHLYCPNCGHSLFEHQKKDLNTTTSNIKKTKIFSKKKDIGLGFNFKDVVKPSLIGFGILFVISAILVFVVNSSIEEGIVNEFAISMDVKLLNPMDLFLFFNSASFTLSTLNSPYEMGSLSLSGMPILFILVPFLIFFIMGVYFAKTNKKLEKSIDLKRILFIGVLYGAIISFISIINRGDISLSIPYLGQRITFKRNFSAPTGFINGTLICVFSLLIGYAVYWKFSKKDTVIGNYRSLFDGLSMFFNCILFVSIATMIFLTLILKKDLSNEYSNLFLLGQLGVYALLITHFTNLRIVKGALGEFSEEKISLLTNVEYIKNDIGNEALIFLYMVVLVVYVSFFIYGKNVKKRGDRNIIYTTLTYSILMGILAYMTHIKLIGTGSLELFGQVADFTGNISVGCSVISTIISSFILSTLSSLAGYFLAKKNKGQVESN